MLIDYKVKTYIIVVAMDINQTK